MKFTLQFIASLFVAVTLFAGESQTQLLSQPIMAHGGSESWGAPDIEFKIVDVPYLDWTHQGYPSFSGIAQTNQILTNAPRSIPPVESNLLALYGITIGGLDPSSKELWLRLDSAAAARGYNTTVEDAGYAAIECIRIVAARYRLHPTLRISSPAATQKTWQEIADRFNKHDLSKPFTKTTAK